MKNAPPSASPGSRRPARLHLAFLALTALLAGSQIAAFSLGTAPVPPKPAPLDFNRDIRPILAQNCLKCHGPDDNQRQAGLRVDVREAVLARLASGSRAIVPGKPAQSELVARIFAHDESQMPPPASNKTLTPVQKTLLQRWITEGAKYEPHWAFVPPKQAALPAVKNTHWARNPIDYFTLARMEKEGLKPAPEADRYTLVRRVYLDLIGIPPTPDEADAFAHDTRPDAYEKLVDRLLASPHYGERWARRWLDLARYADTNGYEKDRPRSIWPYRDWVINALNADMPFDEFTVEQLAGDMLPRATTAQRVATGFHRNTMRNEEGGTDPLEYRFLSMTDRVATTGVTWLGLTVGCAQCHTHKYDPITHTDYYRFFAFLNNCDEPEMALTRPALTASRQAVEAEASAREARLAASFPAAGAVSGAGNLAARFAAWKTESAAKAVHWEVAQPVVAKANVPTLTIEPGGIVFVSGDKTKTDDYEVRYKRTLAGKPITAIRLEALPDDRLPRRGPGRVDYEGPFGDFFLCEFTVSPGAANAPVKLTGATQTFASGSNNAQAAIDGDPLSGWSVSGGQGKTQAAVFRVEKPLDTSDFTARLHFERYYASGLGKFRVSVTTDDRAAQAGLPADIENLLVLPDAARTPAQNDALLRYFLLTAPETAKERAAIQKLRDSAPAYPTTLVLAERPSTDTRATFIHHRGEYLQPTTRVTPGIPGFLSGTAQGPAPKNRLDFARWIVSPTNPLTARVTVNRQWAAFFGRGIVTTTEDFGYQGAPPSHPLLLDWMAVEFVKQGWSLKKLHRLIVTSATYRQSSALTDPLLARDPQNVFLARGPRQRLDAELLRDAALAESGLLSPKIGGPSVFPPQPPGVTTDGAYGALAWNVSAGEDRYRRGLYTFSKRTAPYAMFVTFDAPTGEACVARREVSNTPLQALTLLNDPVFLETAQSLGKLVMEKPGTTGERADYLFRRCATRPPAPDEQKLLVQFYETQKARLATGKAADVAALAGVSAKQSNENNAVERAAWTTLARALLNLDEVITKR